MGVGSRRFLSEAPSRLRGMDTHRTDHAPTTPPPPPPRALPRHHEQPPGRARRRRRLRLLVPAMLALVLLTTAGSCDEKGLGDAPVGQRIEGERDIIVMPDQFANVAVACDGPTRIYVTTREAAPVVVPDHPACTGEDEATSGEG